MQAAWKPLAKLGVPIVAVRDNPRHSEDPLDCLERARDIHPHHLRQHGEGRPRQLRRLPKTAGTVKGSMLLDLTYYYCRDGICPAVIGGVTVYRTSRTSRSPTPRPSAPYIYRGLVDLGALPTPA